jgi:hypothetical protein
VAWAPAARAQRPPLNVYVLDFNNKTKVGGALLGRVAAAQVALQLAESENWDPVPDSQVQRRIQDLGLRPPFDRVARIKIAEGVEAEAVVYGYITDARVGEDPREKSAISAIVRIQVVVEDMATGALVNGAVATGESTARMGFTGDADVLLEEALGKAAYRAREFMDRFRLPEGTVLNTTVVGTDGTDLDALINIGARQGVRRGMEMVVTRRGQLVGRVRTTNVDADVTTARALENTQGIRPEDRVRAIFSFEDFPTVKSRRSLLLDGPVRTASLPGKAARQGPAAAEPAEKPARVAQATKDAEFILLRAPQDAGSRLAQSTIETPPPVVVDEPEPARDEGDGGGGKRRILGGSAFRMLVGGLLVVGLLAIGGRGGKNHTRSHSIEAHGWQVQVGAPGAFIKVCWDRPKGVNSSQVLQYVVWRADVLGSFQIVGATTGDTTHCLIDSEATRTLTNVFDGIPGDEAGGQTTITDVPGIVPGLQYRYQVATAYENGLEDRDGDGVPDDVDFMSPLSRSTGWVTAIAPPVITDPIAGQQVDLGELAVTWELSPGADEYIIWVSSDPNFPANRRTAFGPFRFQPPTGTGQTVTEIVNASGSRLGGARTVFISIGARSSQDPIKPKPFGAIFGTPVSVQPETTPPPPPGSSSNDGKGRGRKDRDGRGNRRDRDNRGGPGRIDINPVGGRK